MLERVDAHVGRVLGGEAVTAAHPLGQTLTAASYLSLVPTIWSLLSRPGEASATLLEAVLAHYATLSAASALKRPALELVTRVLTVLLSCLCQTDGSDRRSARLLRSLRTAARFRRVRRGVPSGSTATSMGARHAPAGHDVDRLALPPRSPRRQSPIARRGRRARRLAQARLRDHPSVAWTRRGAVRTVVNRGAGHRARDRRLSRLSRAVHGARRTQLGPSPVYIVQDVRVLNCVASSNDRSSSCRACPRIVHRASPGCALLRTRTGLLTLRVADRVCIRGTERSGSLRLKFAPDRRSTALHCDRRRRTASVAPA